MKRDGYVKAVGLLAESMTATHFAQVAVGAGVCDHDTEARVLLWSLKRLHLAEFTPETKAHQTWCCQRLARNFDYEAALWVATGEPVPVDLLAAFGPPLPPDHGERWTFERKRRKARDLGRGVVEAIGR